MGKGYKESIEDVKLFTEFMGITLGEFEKYIQNGMKQEEAINEEYRSMERNLTDTKNRINQMCKSEKKKREDCIKQAIIHLKESLGGIRDPHFHRMEKKYIQKCGKGSFRNSTDTPGSVMNKINVAIRELDKRVDELNHAFIPPLASGLIGATVRSFRKSTYMNIIHLRDVILGYCETLMSYTDLQEQKNECGIVFSNRISTEAQSRDEKLEIVPARVKEKCDHLMDLFTEGFAQLDRDTSIFENDMRSIKLGTGYFLQENAGLLRNSVLAGVQSVQVNDTQVSFPVNLSEVKENLLISYEGTENIAGIFCSLAIGILFASEDTEVYFSDIKGLGSSYRQLQPLTEYSSVNIWNSENQVEEGLTEIEKWIADTYEKCLGNNYTSIDEYNNKATTKRKKKYIFINDLDENVPSKCFDQMIRIVNNGINAGVYVISAYALSNRNNNRTIIDFLANMNHGSTSVKISNHLVDIGGNTFLSFKSSFNRSKMNSLISGLRLAANKSVVLPIGPSLPKEGNWQKKSSEHGIVIPFGVNENGRQARFTLSSERPYGLIIGDVRVGKSSLFHTMIFQILANYSPNEVRIAIGDFKDGADFNVYAKGKLKSIDTVVNDEDPDAMLSFLNYYVQEMQSRQRWFEQLEDVTGVIIQKYENYRETNRLNGNVMPVMPRIVLLIDEFQSLFDGASCAALMTELVRKGASYGIHVLLASQRAVSDNPRNGFSSSLKDYFTSRFVFKTPQTAARSMLAERCSDTGRENTGIQKAALLKKGHTIYNSYMGQNEADNAMVQCYYASPEVIANFIQIISTMNGEGCSILLKRNAGSVPCPKKRDGVLRIGTSVMFHRDSKGHDVDTIFDDTEVSLKAGLLKNIILSGADSRILNSTISSFLIWMEQAERLELKMHIFGYNEQIYAVYKNKRDIFWHKSVQEQLNEVNRQISNQTKEYNINIFIEPEKYAELIQSAGSIRSNPHIDSLKKLLEKTNQENGVTIVYSKSYKTLRSQLAYVVGNAPIHITSVGDMENLRYAMSDNMHMVSGAFDVPSKAAIKAYYYNKDTEKFGKVVLYKPS